MPKTLTQEKNGVTKFKPSTTTKRLGFMGALTSLAVSAAHAEGGTTIEIGDVVSTITNGVTVVSSIGVAVLSLVVVIKVFKWARSAM